jgi:hypothetical protein
MKLLEETIKFETDSMEEGIRAETRQIDIIFLHNRTIEELVHEDARPEHHEMLHLWYKSYTLHIIVLWGHTIQRGQSYQLHSYSETVGSDWSGCMHN